MKHVKKVVYVTLCLLLIFSFINPITSLKQVFTDGESSITHTDKAFAATLSSRITISNTFKAESTVDVFYLDPNGSEVLLQQVTVTRTGILNVDVPYANGESFRFIGIDNNDRSLKIPYTIADKVPPNQITDMWVDHLGQYLQGYSQPGATIEVKDPNGNVIGTDIVNDDGYFNVQLGPAQKNGESLSATARDDGGISVPGYATAPDLTAPDAPWDLEVNPQGSSIKGKAQPGSTVEIKDLDGNLLGDVVVNSDGTFRVDLIPAKNNGETIKATATDAGGTSDEAYAIAPDITSPIFSLESISEFGDEVSGKTEPNAKVVIFNSDNELVGSGVANDLGLFTILLDRSFVNGETLYGTASDVAGNVSERDEITAPIIVNKGKITVKYVDENGDDIKPMVTEIDDIGKAFTLVEEQIYGYRLVNKPESLTATFKNDEQNFIFEYEEIMGIVTVQYLVKENTRNDTNSFALLSTNSASQVVLETITLTGKLGDPFETELLTFKGYQLSLAPENPNGTFTEDEQMIVYLYEKLDDEVKEPDEGTKDDEITDPDPDNPDTSVIDDRSTNTTDDNQVNAGNGTNQGTNNYSDGVKGEAITKADGKKFPQTNGQTSDVLLILGAVLIILALVLMMKRRKNSGSNNI